ncbi:membrane protein insertion efficiency factor YidD [Hyphomonas sp. CACIAM 19H1]|uniref:membrane protein insertion efficiency factor YidD n=1 Tax=Hyphomonas sp. CACIAM 19H1 TaxID=1873716 RepID=UPI000DED389B|nr:membrane protein insertion efficiency factor YidD [Hyphomonas sp. CACIAM 19H1]AXE65600.1 membrane protein insertion efficiency factor YidD [Hyphomonas sp. CACIAM 19H1]
MTLRRRTAYVLLAIYKHGPSQALQLFGARCQHHPTCSEYGAECVARHGWWAGGWMALARFIRCRPGGSHGIDPPPETKPAVPFWQPWRYGDWKSGPRDGTPGLVETPPEA